VILGHSPLASVPLGASGVVEEEAEEPVVVAPRPEPENAGGFIVAHPGSIAPSRRKLREVIEALKAAREGQRQAERRAATLKAGKAKAAVRKAASLAKEALASVDESAEVSTEIGRLTDALKAMADARAQEAIVERARDAQRVAEELRVAAQAAEDDDEEAMALILMRWAA
jgi:hypothetical protein